MKLSILDQAPIAAGKTAKEALHQSVKLAQLGDKLGYTRYWIAEHHDLSGLACPTPDVMLGIIGSQTKSIRIGAGAVLLPHYKPFKVAETYNMLATLFPHRIDLGIGRAPGGSAEASMALSGNFLENVRSMPRKLDELLHFLQSDFPKDNMYSKIKPAPVPDVPPNVWLLGTSEKSSILAAEKGLDYAFGHFMSDQDGPAIVQKFKSTYTQKYPIRNSNIIVAVSAICAESTEEAEELAMSNLLVHIKREKGEDNGIPSMVEAVNYPYTVNDRKLMEQAKQKMIVGNPQEVRIKLEQLRKLYDVDEFMIVTITPTYESRLKSYELIAEEML